MSRRPLQKRSLIGLCVLGVGWSCWGSAGFEPRHALVEDDKLQKFAILTPLLFCVRVSPSPLMSDYLHSGAFYIAATSLRSYKNTNKFL